MPQQYHYELHPASAQQRDLIPLPATFAVGGVAFDEADLTAMTAILDQVCAELPTGTAPQEREFVAWLIVRLSRNGVCDPDQVKQSALEAMESGRRTRLPG